MRQVNVVCQVGTNGMEENKAGLGTRVTFKERPESSKVDGRASAKGLRQGVQGELQAEQGQHCWRRVTQGSQHTR